MTATHIEFLVEEPSAEAFLRALLPRLLPNDKTFQIHPFQGKDDLLGKLGARLRGYSHWLPDDWRIFVLIDRDDDDCEALKGQLESIAATAGLSTRTSTGGADYRLVNRIAIEELEAWYFGDWIAVRAAYPRVPANITAKKGLRDSDAIAGGTWEAFERILRTYGYFSSGLRKIEAARAVGLNCDPVRNSSRSFSVFRDSVLAATS